jgi:hypothetical protein
VLPAAPAPCRSRLLIQRKHQAAFVEARSRLAHILALGGDSSRISSVRVFIRHISQVLAPLLASSARSRRRPCHQRFIGAGRAQEIEGHMESLSLGH